MKLSSITYLFLSFYLQAGFASDLDSVFPNYKNDRTQNSCGARCQNPQMPSSYEVENKLVSNPNEPISKMMPGQCMGNTLMHQMLLAGAVFKHGPEMSSEEVKNKLQKLKAGEAQVFTGVSNVAELSENFSPVLKEFANKMQMESFYSLKRLGTAFKVLSNSTKGSSNDLNKMAELTNQGKRPAMILNPPGGTFSTHVVLVDKVTPTPDGYKVSYVDSNNPTENSTMNCNNNGQCQSGYYATLNARALNGSEEEKSFKMMTQKCCLQGTSNPGRDTGPDQGPPQKDHYGCVIINRYI